MSEEKMIKARRNTLLLTVCYDTNDYDASDFLVVLRFSFRQGDVCLPTCVYI